MNASSLKNGKSSSRSFLFWVYFLFERLSWLGRKCYIFMNKISIHQWHINVSKNSVKISDLLTVITSVHSSVIKIKCKMILAQLCLLIFSLTRINSQIIPPFQNHSSPIFRNKNPNIGQFRPQVNSSE